MQDNKTDPLQNPDFKPPGILDRFKEIFIGSARPLDCVQIEVTSFCSGACIYCPHEAQKNDWKSRHMPAETFARLWPVLKRSQRAHLQGWGEPLLHPRFFDFAALAAKAECNVSTTSCGIKMDEDIADKILASGMDLIAFSLVGTDAESNSARKNVPFDRVCQSIKILRQAIKKKAGDNPVEIHLAYLMLADRMEAVKRLPQLMDDLEIDMAVVSTLDYLALPHHKQLAFGPHEKNKLEKAHSILEKAAKQANDSGRIIHFSLPSSEPVAHAGGCRENIAKCIYVDADGQISPCVYLNVPGNDSQDRRRIFGNILKEDPTHIWQKEDFKNFRMNLLNNQPDKSCLNCPKRHEKIFI